MGLILGLKQEELDNELQGTLLNSTPNRRYATPPLETSPNPTSPLINLLLEPQVALQFGRGEGLQHRVGWMDEALLWLQSQ